MIQPAFEILNQRGTPMFFSDVFANRPTAGIVGRIFISTDTYAFYRDTGSGWDLIGGPGSGTITGSGTIGTLPIWNGTQVIGDSSLLEGASKFTTTKDFQADGYYLSGMTAGSGALYWTSDRVTLANYNPTGDVHIEVAGGQAAQVVLGSNLSTTFYGNIIRNGGLSTQFLKADGSLDSSNYITTNIYNANGTLTGNRDVSLNSNYLSFAGGQTYIGSQTTSSGLLTINNSSADAHVQVVGANSPSIRIDNAGTGATRRFVMGLATATNNFIQGSTAGDICISTASASPMLFGMWQTINASEVMRISTANNLIIGSTTDNGNRIQIAGNAYIGNPSGDTRIQTQSTGSTGSSDLRLINTSSTIAYDWLIQGLGADGRFRIYDNAGTTGEWFTILQNGNVGLSNSNPARTLDVSGSGRFTSDLTIANSSRLFLNGSTGQDWALRTNSSTANFEIVDWGSTVARIIMTPAGNVGLGITPSAWATYPALQILRASYWGAADNAYVGANYYWDGSTRRYINTNFATEYGQISGNHQWYIAPSGTAGNAITFTQAMTLDTSGNLGLGTTSANGKMTIIGNAFDIRNTIGNYGTGYAVEISTNAGIPRIDFVDNGAYTGNIRSNSGLVTFQNNSNNALAFGTNSSERGRFSAAGNFLVGTSVDAGFKFDCNGYGRFEGRLVVNDNANVSQIQFLGQSTTVFGIQARDNTGASNRNISINSDGGNVLIGSNTNQGQKLYLNGSLRIDGQLSATAGGSSGQHLIINCDGTTYKIALLNN